MLVSVAATAQNFDGTWEGKLQIATPLRIVFTFTTAPGGEINATMQSPDQSNKVLPVDTCFAKKDSIFLTAKKFGLSFRGKLKEEKDINGIFTQGANMVLQLKKVDQVSKRNRPQTPVAPFSYNSTDVKFYNADHSAQLAGTITWPKDSATSASSQPVFPAVILITGSGPQDRNETLFSHQPFAVIADYLTKKGFVVLRTDDRGVGESAGSFSKATSADFANDVDAAVDFLKKQPQVDTAHIGLIGHSEGGLIAPVVASRRTDIHDIILLAGPGIPIINLMTEQVAAVAAGNTKNENIIAAAKQLYMIAATEVISGDDTSIVKKSIIDKEKKWASTQNKLVLLQMNLLTAASIEANAITQFNAMNTVWYKYFLAFNPQPYLEKLTCNVLALNGSRDIQVLAASNLAGIKTSLGKSKAQHVEVMEMPGLNHLFQSCTTCTVAEYAELEESFSPAALEIISNWLLKYGR